MYTRIRGPLLSDCLTVGFFFLQLSVAKESDTGEVQPRNQASSRYPRMLSELPEEAWKRVW